MNPSRPSRGRSVLVAILGVLACIAITIAATTVWVHQVALNTDRYVSVIAPVARDPRVVEEVSTNLAERVVERIEVPRLVKPLLQNWIQEQIATFMQSDTFVDGWAEANRVAHSALVRLLRSEAILPEEPVTISVSQLIVIGIGRLQEVGIIPDDLELPSPTDGRALEAIRELLAERLDIDLAADFGQVTLVRPARLEMARQFVRIFDFVTVASALVAVGLLALTVWLARNRLRAVVLLGVGAAIALLAAIASTAAISSVVVSALAEFGARNTLGAILDALLGNLATALLIVLVVGLLTVIAVVLIGRQPSPVEAMAVASPVPVPWPPPPAPGGAAGPRTAEPSGSEASPSPADAARSTPAAADRKSPAPSKTKESTSAGAKPAAKPPAKPRAKPPAKPRAKPPAKPRAKPASKGTQGSRGPSSPS